MSTEQQHDALLAEIERLQSALNEALADAVRAYSKLNGLHVSARAHRDEIKQLKAERDTLAQAVHMLRTDADKMRAELDALRAQEPARPDIIERLTYHAHERDDMSIDDCLSYLASGWKTVRGRTERELVLQLLSLLAAAPQPPRDVERMTDGQIVGLAIGAGVDRDDEDDDGTTVFAIARAIESACAAAWGLGLKELA